MSYVKIPSLILEDIIKTLQRGYDVCDGVDYSSDKTEKTTYYANGYSRATIRDVIERLNKCKEMSN
jgi:hypothetical protein